MPQPVWTIGHSTRTLTEFLQLLALHRVELIADVRRYPGSRRWPQFTGPTLKKSLATAGISYAWLPTLGGRRRPASDSLNTAWRSPMFRGYADHMATAEFAEGLAEVESYAYGLRTCLMCAEAVWWRCHRGLVSDVLKWHGFQVCHILSLTSTLVHPYTSAARITRQGLSYAATSVNARTGSGAV
jgi:uncharacterized protein (DUF488 family)